MLKFIFQSLFLISAFANPKIVYVHGLGVEEFPFKAFVPLKSMARSYGFELLIADVPSADAVVNRAKALQEFIQNEAPQDQIHLIGHSMGGIDSRFFASNLDSNHQVISVTTLASPHLGSALADRIVLELDNWPSIRDRFERWFPQKSSAYRDLTTWNMARFNLAYPNRSNVKYQSMAFYMQESPSKASWIPTLWLTHEWLKREGYPDNDGMVPLESQIWGELLGVFPGDHYSSTAPVPYDGKIPFYETFKIVLESLTQMH